MKFANLFGALVVWSVGTFGCSAAPEDARDTEPEVASVQQALSTSALTQQQASTVLKLVDDICGDSWCEGDHNFHFDRIDCTRACGKAPGTCRLTFRLFPYDSDLNTGPTYTRSCTTGHFSGFASLVDTAPNGYQSLNWQYYDALTECISAVESQLPAH